MESRFNEAGNLYVRCDDFEKAISSFRKGKHFIEAAEIAIRIENHELAAETLQRKW